MMRRQVIKGIGMTCLLVGVVLGAYLIGEWRARSSIDSAVRSLLVDYSNDLHIKWRKSVQTQSDPAPILADAANLEIRVRGEILGSSPKFIILTWFVAIPLMALGPAIWAYNQRTLFGESHVSHSNPATT